MERFCHLSLMLSRQIELYREFLAIENAKTRILVQGKAQELDEFIIKEQALIMQSANLENERQSLQQTMGINQLTLRQIVEKYAPNNEYGLKMILFKFSALLDDIKKANGLNTRLIQSRLNTMRHLLYETDMYDGQLTYSK